jgi:hypothetical protein
MSPVVGTAGLAASSLAVHRWSGPKPSRSSGRVSLRSPKCPGIKRTMRSNPLQFPSASNALSARFGVRRSLSGRLMYRTEINTLSGCLTPNTAHRLNLLWKPQCQETRTGESIRTSHTGLALELLGDRGVPVETDLVRGGLPPPRACQLRSPFSQRKKPSREGQCDSVSSPSATDWRVVW